MQNTLLEILGDFSHLLFKLNTDISFNVLYELQVGTPKKIVHNYYFIHIFMSVQSICRWGNRRCTLSVEYNCQDSGLFVRFNQG